MTGSANNSPFSLTAGNLAGTGSIEQLTTSGGIVSPGVGGIGTLTLTGASGAPPSAAPRCWSM